ncbi:hypothetical protein [Saccharothrix xinjiangensis]|uniref:Uncharacterized protein n=1 Tax=Saccharothrix xinjiangensis TaxID=204798 RepID=A0ABV9XV98_9PSEU
MTDAVTAAKQHAHQVARVAADFPIGIVVERSGIHIRTRRRRILRERP